MADYIRYAKGYPCNVYSVVKLRSGAKKWTIDCGRYEDVNSFGGWFRYDENIKFKTKNECLRFISRLEELEQNRADENYVDFRHDLDDLMDEFFPRR